MIRFTFFCGILLFCLACNTKGNKDKIGGTDSLAALDAFITKDSMDLLSHKERKDKQIWINRSLEDYLLGKDSVLAERSPMALTIDEKGAFLSYRYEGNVSYFPFKLGMKDFNYQDMTLSTAADSVIALKMKNGGDFTFVLRRANDNGMPDISKSLLRNLLPAERIERMSSGDSKESATLLCVERSWSDAAYCSCDRRTFKYKLSYDYPVQTVSGTSKPVYYITISDRQGPENTYKMDRQENKTLLRDLNSGEVKYTWYTVKPAAKNISVQH
jgi:hypothetical protein